MCHIVAFFYMVETRRHNYPNPAQLPAELQPALAVEPPLHPEALMADIEPELPHVDEEEDADEAVPEVRNRPLPRDASKLPVFRGEELDIQQLEAFLIDLRRYFRVNHASFQVDPDDALKLAVIAQCFPLTSLARLWYDDAESTFRSLDDFEAGLRENFAAGEANLIKLQQQWESARQGRYSARDFYHFLLKLRMRIAAADSAEQPTEREFLRKYCASLREPAKTEISKKRIAEPELSLPQLVKLAELEDKPSGVANAAAALRAIQFPPRGKRADKTGGPSTSKAKYCFYCPSARNHTPEECRRIAARKAAGTWEEKPPPRK